MSEVRGGARRAEAEMWGTVEGKSGVYPQPAQRQVEDVLSRCPHILTVTLQPEFTRQVKPGPHGRRGSFHR